MKLQPRGPKDDPARAASKRCTLSDLCNRTREACPQLVKARSVVVGILLWRKRDFQLLATEISDAAVSTGSQVRELDWIG